MSSTNGSAYSSGLSDKSSSGLSNKGSSGLLNKGSSGLLNELIEPVVTAMDYEFVGLEYLNQGNGSVLRIYIDQEQGISVDDCADVSRQISAVLDVEDPIPGEYTLEVSSPGMDRPLFTKEHYIQFVGHEIKLSLIQPSEETNRKRFRGILSAVQGEEIILEVDNEEFCLPINNIAKANLVVQF